MLTDVQTPLLGTPLVPLYLLQPRLYDVDFDPKDPMHGFVVGAPVLLAHPEPPAAAFPRETPERLAQWDLVEFLEGLG